MSGPKDAPAINATDRRVRAPAVAGSFYPREPGRCGTLAEMYVSGATLASEAEKTTLVAPPGGKLIGGIVPHAGWVCSGAIAGLTIGSIARSRSGGKPDVIFVFGAVHTPLPCDRPTLDEYDSWETPGSAIAVLAGLRTRIAEATDCAIDNRFHRDDHAIEVELPLIEYAWPGVGIVPVEVPLIDAAVAFGRGIARLIAQRGIDAVILASSDLTHYGPDYRFGPAGYGAVGLEWEKDNDRRLLEKIEQMQVDQIVPHVRQSQSACGGGAITAMLAACGELGAKEARALQHTNSFDVLTAKRIRVSSDNAVGYAAVVVG